MGKTDYDKTIKRLYVTDGMAMNKIADQLHISVGKVYNQIKSMGLKTREIGDYPPSEKVIKHITAVGKARKGKKASEESKKKMSESKFRGGIGHKKQRDDGYIYIYFPDHPKSTKDGYIMEHILVMECAIGRHLNDDEVVHHKNHIINDNRLSNLQLMTFKEHAGLHMKERHDKRRNDLSIK